MDTNATMLRRELRNATKVTPPLILPLATISEDEDTIQARHNSLQIVDNQQLLEWPPVPFQQRPCQWKGHSKSTALPTAGLTCDTGAG
eukprot:CAMPEP_0183372538 /NCGR_PEP_ID=MMETSP0164_2-20130417/108730_1 /TAXON_ID=221442 /ORGANISM="Coccolithus pelagicus ssp braarudi, Strain PLY182g" /LENGTH=87 /DNA_ID=CAMNT_0025549261 /DNA_START=1 /DNA_END=261 /DNA_ORIENTATION=-